MNLPELKLKDFNYSLPEEKIAEFPLSKRDSSKLLLFKNKVISHHIFHETPKVIPEKSFIVFNDTKVISARLIIKKQTGAKIEIFLLEPYKKTVEEAMIATEWVEWKCMIGNLKRWKQDETLSFNTKWGDEIHVMLKDKNKFIVRFSWDSVKIFSDILKNFGKTPLPPYIKREVEESDKDRYQTVYSAPEGAVAAPTAGLHFTKEILKKLNDGGHNTDYVTLHVGAGTFAPVKTENIINHKMHNEKIIVNKNFLKNLHTNLETTFAVGTTSMRTLESLYWYGTLLESKSDSPFLVSQYYPYEYSGKTISVKQSIENILNYMERKNLEQIDGNTEIFIVPGYKFQVVKGLFTNFHMPKSTLIMLISAFIGDNWRKIYEEALKNNYRFLSYGDTSLLIP